MSTIAIYNGFGKYEQTSDGQKGITLQFGGVPFWFPYDKVSYIPDFMLRELDHKESAAEGAEAVYLTYHTPGEVIANELLESQVPYKNREKGMIVIANDPQHRKNSMTKVAAGWTVEGRPIVAEVQEVEPSEYEIAEAHRLANDFKQRMIQDYLMSKRERITGGHGRAFPDGLTKVFMDELGVKDVDDVTKSMETAAPGITQDQFLAALKIVMEQKAGPPPVPAVPVGPPGAKPKPATVSV